MSTRLYGHDPLTYFIDIPERLPTARMVDLDVLLPWDW